MSLAILAILGGFILLTWSAARFVEGAAATAKYAGMPPLLIGMVIVGFGTSAPEMVVSAMAAIDGNSDLALGNALGSNIVNTGLILGLAALIAPIMVHSEIVRKEIPLLLAIGLLSGIIYWNGAIARFEAIILLFGFAVVVGWSIYAGLRSKNDVLGSETEKELELHMMSFNKAIFWVFAGLLFLIISSRILVWGAVTIAHSLGISDLIIGLTIVALGTSLPELAATIIAARKGEHDIAIGNVIGSNMFNLLAVVGIAGVIAPIEQLSTDVLTRDWPVMMAMTVGLFLMAYAFKGQSRLNRLEGGILLVSYIAYNAWLVSTVMNTH